MSTIISLAGADISKNVYSVDLRRHVSQEYRQALAESRLMVVRSVEYEAIPDELAEGQVQTTPLVHAGSPRRVSKVMECEINPRWVSELWDGQYPEATEKWREANPV